MNSGVRKKGNIIAPSRLVRCLDSWIYEGQTETELKITGVPVMCNFAVKTCNGFVSRGWGPVLLFLFVFLLNSCWVLSTGNSCPTKFLEFLEMFIAREPPNIYNLWSSFKCEGDWRKICLYSSGYTGVPRNWTMQSVADAWWNLVSLFLLPLVIYFPKTFPKVCSSSCVASSLYNFCFPLRCHFRILFCFLGSFIFQVTKNFAKVCESSDFSMSESQLKEVFIIYSEI